MKKFLILIIASIFVITGCGSNEEKEKEKATEEDNTPNEVKEIEKIASCPDCVYFYSDNTIHPIYFEGEKSQALTDYTDDYTSLKTSNNYKAQAFLGGVLDSKEMLTKTYVCGYNDMYYCLEASTDGSTYKANVELMNEVFGEENCNIKTSSYEPDNYDCRAEKTYAISYVTGEVSIGVYSPSQGCFSQEEGYIDCR